MTALNFLKSTVLSGHDESLKGTVEENEPIKMEQQMLTDKCDDDYENSTAYLREKYQFRL